MGSSFRTRESAATPGGVRLASLLLDDERVLVVRAVERARYLSTVEEQRRRGVDTHAVADVDVLPDARAGGGIVEAAAKRRELEAELTRVAKETFALEMLVVLEEHVVVLPEPSLLAGAFGGDRREARVRMQRTGERRVAARVEGVVAEDEADIRARPDEFLQVGERFRTVGTFEIGELDDGDGRVAGTLGVLFARRELAKGDDVEAVPPVDELRVALAHLGEVGRRRRLVHGGECPAGDGQHEGRGRDGAGGTPAGPPTAARRRVETGGERHHRDEPGGDDD